MSKAVVLTVGGSSFRPYIRCCIPSRPIRAFVIRIVEVNEVYVASVVLKEPRIRPQRLASDAVPICIKVMRVPTSAFLKEVLSFLPSTKVVAIPIRFIRVWLENFARDSIPIPVEVVWIPGTTAFVEVLRFSPTVEIAAVSVCFTPVRGRKGRDYVNVRLPIVSVLTAARRRSGDDRNAHSSHCGICA